MTNKAIVVALLEIGPATTGEIRQAMRCANSAQAYSTLEILEDYGVIERERGVQRIAPSGPKTTTRWRLVSTPKEPGR